MLGFGKWNEIMSQFLDELHATFPEDRDNVDVFRLGVTTASLVDESKPCALFVGAIRHHEVLLEAKDPAFFDGLHRVAGVDFGSMYRRSPDAHTKHVIFEYVATLYCLGKHLLAP